MFNLEELENAEKIISKLANGVNPITEEKLDSELFNDVNIIRCLFLVRSVLEKVIDNKGVVKKKRHRNQKIEITPEFLSKYTIKNEPISLSSFLQEINDINPNMKKIRFKAVSDLLYEQGILIEKREGLKRRVASEEAMQYGIYNAEKWSYRGPYIAVLYNEKGQQYLLDNLHLIKIIDEPAHYGY